MSQHDRALLDTSVVIDPPADLARYTAAGAISTITLAELAFGLHTGDPLEDARRASVYQDIVTTYRPIPYSVGAARVYGALCAAVRQVGRSPRPRRFDLLVASVAAEADLPLLTRNPADFEGIHAAVKVVPLTFR